MNQPLSAVEWVDPDTLHANDYNPNKVFPDEFDLLAVSILEDGWTQPIVVARSTREIVDGFHRWTLGRTNPEVRAMTGGLVPVVYVDPRDEASQRMATIRHNRARGAHGVVRMGEIVRFILDSGVSEDDVCRRLGMEIEEVDRLADFRPGPEVQGRDHFGAGWIPR